MKKDEKLNALFDRFDSNIMNDIQTQLDEELSKSDKDFNPDKVAELTAVIARIKGGTLTEERKLNNIGKITDAVMAEQKRSQINRICKVLSTVCACLFIVIGLNIYTMNTFGDDLFSAAIKAAQNGFSLDFSGDSNDTPPNEDDPVEALSTTTAADYGEDDTGTTVTAATPESPVTETDINEQPVTETSENEIFSTTTCAPVNIDDSTTTAEETATYHSDTPTVPDDSTSTSTVPCSPDDENTNISAYINDICSNNNVSACNIDNSFMPAMQEAESEIEYTQYSTDIYFHFTADNARMDIIIENYYNKKDIPEMLIPSASMNYEIISIPCGTAFLFTENDITTAVFSQGSTVYTITGQSSENSISDIIKNAAKGFIPDTEN
ncbi:MAG: hypothetical protein J6I55_10820 [Ruminococcus sp.]|nr:hypothetical protein [Ruminococcus sp.]